MCYDISFSSSIETIQDYFPDLVYDTQISLDLNSTLHVMGNFVFPEYPIIYRNRDDDKLHLNIMEWGVITYYAKGDLEKSLKKYPDDKVTAYKEFQKNLKTIRNGMLNARSERILDDAKSYWNKIRNRRCLIPVSGIYEHREVKGWKNKVPYIVKPCDQGMFFLPGLYSVAELPDATTGEMQKIWTFTLITRPANALMRTIHNHGENKWRMPLFLPLELSKRWLDPDLDSNEAEYRNILNYEIPSEDLAYQTTFTIRSPKPRPDGLPKNQPYAWPDLPALGLADPE
jgi:putative SOS response-associated peptidase YedK